MADKKPCTLKEVWHQAGQRLINAGCEGGTFEAEVMLRTLLGWERSQFFLQLATIFPESLEQKLDGWIHARIEGVPLQHLTGQQEFYGRSFVVSPHVLIPRPDTEILVESILHQADSLSKRNSPLHFVDVGTGSGILAITLAAECPEWKVTAIDCSAEALMVAKINAERHGVGDRIQFLQGEWLMPLQASQQKVDMVVSNPPYIPSIEVEKLDGEVKDYEPRLALDGGEDGLNPYRILLQQIPQILRRPGYVAFEIGWDQGVAVTELVNALSCVKNTKVIPDLAGRDRVVTFSMTDCES
ncbi:peptide chain release factor N(5)-glutamine methyltransferase [Marininema halotolerans]|uniref:Release factor glutamine methyltransferase n=1 Tax=Marininema halotolerans TaxID=1155944 RepID=A0A1I6P468_9BACL|nr:peptide chain release factor N(5)-glutamine methyltransferase [Marininema halotolerans]SFS34890.1 release factor glutamine methyltransferase [Marininema halotolerans]